MYDGCTIYVLMPNLLSLWAEGMAALRICMVNGGQSFRPGCILAWVVSRPQFRLARKGGCVARNASYGPQILLESPATEGRSNKNGSLDFFLFLPLALSP